MHFYIILMVVAISANNHIVVPVNNHATAQQCHVALADRTHHYICQPL